ncbi:MAG: hypothetical protein IPM29_06320 [Planctomycetes bacterium]|nr:hypothetical protein [Planctomycetota bacterium]
MSEPRPSILATFGAAVLSLAAAVPGQRPGPQPAEGDLARVACRVVRAWTTHDSVLLEVEVQNGTAAAFEPLRFAIEAPPHAQREEPVTVTVDRAPLPHVQRAGRPVEPRGRARYLLQATIWQLPPKLSVEVDEGLFFAPDSLAGLLPDAAPVELVGAPTQETFADATGTRPRTTLTLRNTADRPVDAILRATATRPLDAEVLLTVSLPAGSTRAVTIEDLPAALGWSDLPAGLGARIERAEVVDWTLQFPRDEDAAREALLRAYATWVRWDRPRAIAGSLRIREQELDGTVHAGVGTFVMAADGTPRVTWTEGDAARLGAASALRNAFADLRRPSAEELAAANRFDPFGGGWVAIDGPGIDGRPPGSTEIRTIRPDGGESTRIEGQRELPLYLVDGDELHGSGWSSGHGRIDWRTQRLDDGFVVTERRSADGTQLWHSVWTRVQGVVVPAAYRTARFTATGELSLETVLELGDLHVADDRAGELAAPAGAGVDALRAAWDATWRYPDEPVTLTAEFDIETPGTDLVWVGQKRVRGSLTLTGFRGFRHWGSGWATLTCSFDPSLPATQHGALSAAIHDRLILWAGRDLAGRGPFDEVFAGATIDAPAGGRFAIHGGRYGGVEIADGRVVALEIAPGSWRRTRFAKAGDAQVPNVVTTGIERLRATWRSVDGYLCPTAFVFERSFGTDWGPEKLTLRNLRLTR